jgi:hypothetical protein
MLFFERQGWVCNFLELDLKTPIGPIRTFASLDKIRELIDRTPTKHPTEFRQALDYGISQGRGAMYIELNAAQYQKLKAQRQPAFTADPRKSSKNTRDET